MQSFSQVRTSVKVVFTFCVIVAFLGGFFLKSKKEIEDFDPNSFAYFYAKYFGFEIAGANQVILAKVGEDGAKTIEESAKLAYFEAVRNLDFSLHALKLDPKFDTSAEWFKNKQRTLDQMYIYISKREIPIPYEPSLVIRTTGNPILPSEFRPFEFFNQRIKETKEALSRIEK